MASVREARRRNIITETMMWEGITLLLSYEPDWLGLGAAGHDGDAHLELHVLEPKGAPLPLTDTGYWSEFLGIGEAEAAGGPKAVAEALLNEFANTQTWRVRLAKWEQRDLFS